MTIESYCLVEHYDYICKSIPQPFSIHCDQVEGVESVAEEYIIKTKQHEYSVSTAAIRKLVDALGIKIKLLSYITDEVNVIDLVLPALNKLFKNYADCFVFYARSDDPLTIIDLNVNGEKGEEGTKYEKGPSPWLVQVEDSPELFTCFSQFRSKYCIDSATDGDILVKSDDIMSNANQVVMNLFKPIKDANLQPMLQFSSKFSNMDGFQNINVSLHEPSTGINITFPMNYADHDRTFDELWKKAMHLLEKTDLNDYIFAEMNELAASSDTPNSIKKFINDLNNESTVNMNQPINQILADISGVAANMKPGKKKSFMKSMGNLIAFCLVAKHSCCSQCGHLEINK